MSNTDPKGQPYVLMPIPDYDGVYYMTPEGNVVNRNNKPLKTFNTKNGDAIELRNRGQREVVLIDDLKRKLEKLYGHIGTD